MRRLVVYESVVVDVSFFNVLELFPIVLIRLFNELLATYIIAKAFHDGARAQNCAWV